MRKLVMVASAAALLMVGAVLSPINPVRATHRPADKMAVAGASIDRVPPGQAVPPLLTGTLKTSSPTDLIIGVTLECDIVTFVETTGNAVAEATTTIRVWVELDGAPVKVADGDPDGKVVFCNRAHRQSVSKLGDSGDNDDATISQFLKTRTANAFQWITFNTGNKPSPHTITLHAELESTDPTGVGVIGKRTMIVQPVKLANDADAGYSQG